MATFDYKAKRMDGSEISGSMEAADRESLIQRIRADGLYVYKIHRTDGTGPLPLPPVRSEKLAAFCIQMSAMLTAGISVAAALDICRRSAGDKKLQNTFMELSEEVQKGQSLSQAMTDMGSVFPRFLIHMVETGETSGNLDEIFQTMSEHYEQEVELRGKVQTALIYPCVLLVVTLATTLFILTFVLPQFARMFEDGELPLLTRALMGISSVMVHDWPKMIAGLLLVLFLFLWLSGKRRFRYVADQCVLRFPVAGGLLHTLYTTRFASTFSILYGSGIGILKSLDIAGKVLGNSYAAGQLQIAATELSSGELLADVLERTGIFLPVFISMVAVGEEAGNLEQILADTGAFYHKSANAAINRLIALLEPVMIVTMAAVISLIVIGIMLPIFRMYGYIL